MLVTFKTSAYSDITMFGTAAVALLKLMGQSGNVPGAILADEVPEALRRLEEGLAAMSNEQTESDSDLSSNVFDDNEEQEAAIGLDKRAGPLLSLLGAAIAANENVLWDS